MWDIQVTNLDHTCPPSLPPYAKIEEYSAEQLRRIAIEAVRIRDSWTKGPSPSVRLEQKQTIARNPTASEEPPQPPKFFPGGRFLAFFDSRMLLQIIDLHDAGRLALTYYLLSEHRPDRDEDVVLYSYDVGMLEDGTLVLAYDAMVRENGIIHE